MNKFSKKVLFFLLLLLLFILLIMMINSQHKIQKLNVDEVTEFVIVSPPSKKQ